MTRRLLSRLCARRVAVLLVLTATVWPAAPAAAQSRREMQMMADIRMLQEQTQQLQQQLQAALDAIGAQLKAISARVDEQAGATRKSFADQKLAVDQFGTDLRIVRERIDESNVRITSLSQEVEALRLAIPEMTTAPAVPGAPNAPPVGDVPEQVAPPVAMAPGMTPQRLFNTSLADFTVGQWALCIQGFTTYLQSYSRTDAADDAQWYIGECYFSDGKFAEAVDAYNRTITSYPKGDRVPDAYYKLGVALNNMKQADRAREAWEALIKEYPDSDMARLAKQRLDGMPRTKPAGD